MVEENEDAAFVTERIERETRNFAAMRAAEDSRQKSSPAQLSADDAATDESVVMVVPPPVQTRPADADTAFRHARLGVTAALVLLLMLVWIIQRRSTASGGGS